MAKNMSIDDWSRFESAIGSYTAEVEQKVLKNVTLALSHGDADTEVCMITLGSISPDSCQLGQTLKLKRTNTPHRLAQTCAHRLNRSACMPSGSLPPPGLCSQGASLSVAVPLQARPVIASPHRHQALTPRGVLTRHRCMQLAALTSSHGPS